MRSRLDVPLLLETAFGLWSGWRTVDLGIAVRVYWFMDVYFDFDRVTESSYFNFIALVSPSRHLE